MTGDDVTGSAFGTAFTMLRDEFRLPGALGSLINRGSGCNTGNTGIGFRCGSLLQQDFRLGAVAPVFGLIVQFTDHIAPFEYHLVVQLLLFSDRAQAPKRFDGIHVTTCVPQRKIRAAVHPVAAKGK